ncbi:hypothetical protein VNI00_016456 [Paramarasmius palmivorus]|uniref:Crinkler (CRN) family protein n=1 Tax=Paramarasmius palmivorus TaxID=297713 RepID=A0AAW0BE64_9AGAR
MAAQNIVVDFPTLVPTDTTADLYQGMNELHNIAWVRQARHKLYSVDPVSGSYILKVLFSMSGSGPPSIVIRDEYYRALQDCLLFMDGTNDFDTPYTADEANCLYFDAEDVRSSSTSGEASGTPTLIPKCPSEIDWKRQPDGDAQNRTFVVTGSPGIGKTLWLYFVLVERLLRRQHTFLQFTKQDVFYWHSNGCTTLEIASLKLGSLDPGYWFLIDSNTAISDPPFIFTLSRCRFVLSASCRDQRFVWLGKLSSSNYKWIMKPTSVSEVLIMNRFQEAVNDENKLISFCDSYGSCARYVFQCARNPKSYKRTLKAKLRKLSIRDLRDLVYNGDQSLPVKEEVSHLVVGIYPGPSRDDPYITIYTPSLLTIIESQFAAEWDDKAWDLFDSFRSTPQTRVPAGRILESRLHQTLAKGGQWEANTMVAVSEGDQNVIFSDNVANRKRAYVKFGRGARVRSKSSTSGSTPLDVHRFSFADFKKSFRETGYYRPLSQTHATYDSFVLDKKRETLVIIQSTMSTQHDVNKKGLAYLEEKWATGSFKIHYVVITDDETKTVRIPISKQYAHLIKKKVHICMGKADLFPVSRRFCFVKLKLVAN